MPVPAEVGREGDDHEGEGREEVRRVHEDVRRREEVLEGMLGVPAPVPGEADAEREDVKEHGEPEEPVRGRRARPLGGRSGRGGAHADPTTRSSERLQ